MADQADLYCRNRQIIQHCASLLLQQFHLYRLYPVDIGCVLYGQAGDRRGGPATESGNGLYIGLNPGATRGVVSGYR
jgi:hypothetical protein